MDGQDLVTKESVLYT